MLRPDLNRKREEKMRHHPYGRADNAPPRRGGGERDGRRMNSSNDQYPRQGGGGDRMYGGRMSGEPMPQYGGPPPMGMDPSGMMSMPPSGAYPQSMQPGMNMMQPYMGMPQMMPYYDLNQMNMSASAGQGMRATI